MRVDNRQWVRAHAAGTHGMKVGACGGPNVCPARRVVLHIDVGREYRTPPAGKHFRAGYLMSATHPGDHQVEILGYGEVGGVDQERVSRAAAAELNRPAASGTHQ